jgi:hypothetical protein
MVALYCKYYGIRWTGPENDSAIKTKAAGSWRMHLNRCFAVSAYDVLWLWQSPLQKTISEIKFLLKGTRLISFVKVDRSQNRVSHCLANLARAKSRTMVWLGSRPESIRQALDLDLLVNPAV